jgi:hypothetical protein
MGFPAGATGEKAPRWGCHCYHLLNQNCVVPAMIYTGKVPAHVLLIPTELVIGSSLVQPLGGGVAHGDAAKK